MHRGRFGAKRNADQKSHVWHLSSLINGAASQFRTSYYEMVLGKKFTQQNIMYFCSFGRNPSSDAFILWQCTSVVNIANVHKLPGLLCKITHNDVCTSTKVV